MTTRYKNCEIVFASTPSRMRCKTCGTSKELSLPQTVKELQVTLENFAEDHTCKPNEE